MTKREDYEQHYDACRKCKNPFIECSVGKALLKAATEEKSEQGRIIIGHRKQSRFRK